MIRLVFNIAFKFILHKTKGILGFVRKTFYLAIVGLILSILSLILLNSIGNGYKSNLKDKLLELESDIEIISNSAVNVKELISLAKEFSNQGLKSYCVTSKGPAIIKSFSLSEGVEVTTYVEGECDISLKKGEVVLGAELKGKLKTDSGSEISIINPYKLLESMGLNKNPISLTIKSFLKTGTPEDKYRIIIHKEDFLSLFGDKSSYTSSSIKIYLEDSDEQNNLKSTLYNKDIYKTSEIYTFNDKYQLLSESLNQIFITISIILYFFIALSILNITSSIWLIVESKNNQIYYLILAGMRKYQICSIFIIITLFLIAGSFISGYLLAELIVVIQNKYHIVSIPSNVYIISELKGILDYKYIFSFFVFFMAIGTLFSFIPSYRAIQEKDIYV